MKYQLLIRRFSTNNNVLYRTEKRLVKEDGAHSSIFWARSLAGQKTHRTEPLPDENIPVLVIPGHTKVPEVKKAVGRKRRQVPPPRYLSMPVNQDWTNVWPSAQTFRWSSVPFPVRQGVVEGEENDGIPPGKYANAELLKVPNFLHLTPLHIKKHCTVLKKYCTPWPKELNTVEACEQHFPVTVITSDIILDGPSTRDVRTRGITVKLKLSALDLDEHASDKLLRLVGNRYDHSTDVLTIESTKCPMKKQNYEYITYLLTVLYLESKKIEPWEAEKTAEDMEKYVWDMMPSKQKLLDTLKRMKEAYDKQPLPSKSPSYLAKLSSADQVDKSTPLNQYKTAITELFDEGESLQTLSRYKDAVKNLLLARR